MDADWFGKGKTKTTIVGLDNPTFAETDVSTQLLSKEDSEQAVRAVLAHVFHVPSSDMAPLNLLVAGR